jgi:glycosyltransferase involved in cell wall biosynthesis
MRILHVLGKLDRGGVETWLLQVLSHIDRQKYQMDFLVHTTDPGAYDQEVRALGAQIIPCLCPSSPLRYALNFQRILRHHGPYDVVHSHVHHYSGYVLMLAAMAGVPVRIAHSHNDTTNIDLRGSVARSAYLKITKTLVNKSSTLGIAASKMAGDSLFPSGWESSPKWQVVHYGVDFAPFDTSVDRTEVRRQLGIPSGSIVVGHVGRFDPQKNHEFLVDIASRFIRLQPRAHFLLVGDGVLRPKIEKQISDSTFRKHFHLAGLRDDVPRLLCAAMDVFLFPSKYEGLPVALLEAQAAGLPCLVSDSVTTEGDAIAELTQRESLEHDADQWANSLLALAQCRRLSPAAARSRLPHWSIEASADRLLAFYDGMATQCPTSAKLGQFETGS